MKQQQAGILGSTMARPFHSVTDRRNSVGRQQLLTPDSRTDAVPHIADQLVGLHSSDPATVHLSAGLRMRNPSTDAIERALYEDRSVVRLHGFRNTMWVMTPALASAMFWSTSVRLATNQTRRLVSLVQANAVAPDAEVWVAEAKAVLLAALTERGTATTRQLGVACPEVAIPLEIQGTTVSAHSRLMMCLGFEGVVVRTRPLGSWISSQYVWAPMGSWVRGGLHRMDPRVAARTILDAYLTGFGPATFTDISWWTGWTAGMTHTAIEDASAVAVQTDDGEAFVVADRDPNGCEGEPWIAFLPSLDPTTMGWKQRDWYLGRADAKRLFDRNGNAGPTVWMDGRIVGGWTQAEDGEIRYSIFDDEAMARVGEVDAEADRVAALYGETRHRPRFPTATQRELF